MNISKKTIVIKCIDGKEVESSIQLMFRTVGGITFAVAYNGYKKTQNVYGKFEFVPVTDIKEITTRVYVKK